jgi:hypothetical protein
MYLPYILDLSSCSFRFFSNLSSSTLFCTCSSNKIVSLSSISSSSTLGMYTSQSKLSKPSMIKAKMSVSKNETTTSASTLLPMNMTTFFNVFHIMHFTAMFTHTFVFLFACRIRDDKLHHVVHGTCVDS